MYPQEVAMPIFKKVHEFFSTPPGMKPTSKELLTLLTKLDSYGVNTHLAQRGRAAEEIGSNRWHSDYRWCLDFSIGHSLGLIDIKGLPIRWVNVKEHELKGNGESPGYHDIWYVYGITCKIPDFLSTAHLHLKTVKKRNWILGEAIGIEWQGYDSNLGIIERLNQADLIADLFLEGANTYLEIDAVPRSPLPDCWIITTRSVPGPKLWECYLTIANELLVISGHKPVHISLNINKLNPESKQKRPMSWNILFTMINSTTPIVRHHHP